MISKKYQKLCRKYQDILDKKITECKSRLNEVSTFSDEAEDIQMEITSCIRQKEFLERGCITK